MLCTQRIDDNIFFLDAHRKKKLSKIIKNRVLRVSETRTRNFYWRRNFHDNPDVDITMATTMTNNEACMGRACILP